MTKLERVKQKLEGDVLSPDQYARHLFELWTSGCYGQEVWNRQLATVKRDYMDNKRMRGFVIHEFCTMLANECDCSVGYAGSIVAKTFDKDTLDKLNLILVREVRDYFMEYIT